MSGGHFDYLEIGRQMSDYWCDVDINWVKLKTYFKYAVPK